MGSAVSRLPEEGLGRGGEKATGKNRGAQLPLLASPGSWGAGRGTGGWNPEQRVEELLAFTSIVLVHSSHGSEAVWLLTFFRFRFLAFRECI